MVSPVTGNVVGSAKMMHTKHVHRIQFTFATHPMMPSPMKNGPGTNLTSGWFR